MNQVNSSAQPLHPGLIIAALRGGSGKTIFSVGIIAALRNRDKRIAPFKKGPDYIDAGWLALAAGRPCYNLDTFLVEPDRIFASYFHNSQHSDFAIIEGNRGLYDCINLEGKTSTAELAKQLELPVILCLDATKTTRTMAAVVSGCQQFDPKVNIAAVVLNRVAGPRHRKILTDSIEKFCRIPVVGAVPKLRAGKGFPERHMGLVPTPEHSWARQAVDQVSRIAERYLDLDKIEALALGNKDPSIQATGDPVKADPDLPLAKTCPGHWAQTEPVCRIGVLCDSAFQFYYPENLEALECAGARLVFTSPLTDKTLPDVDGLYIGGGFPETHAEALSANRGYNRRIKELAEAGFPIYAECGGLMYLGQALVLENNTYPMTDVLPIVFGFSKRPQGHGYTVVKVENDNPYFEKGTLLKGHEFHYSNIKQWSGNPDDLVFSMQRGHGIINGKDGLCHKNVLATYTHIHALGCPQWAPALIKAALKFKSSSSKTIAE